MITIERGAVGDEVLDVQRRLEDLGLSCDGDEPGVFGGATERAVRTFQQQRSLTADGAVGPDTWRVLVGAGFDYGDRLLFVTRPMLRGDDIRELQRRLNRLGFDAGYDDGIYGPQTQAAVREFQLNAGLQEDGRAGPETFHALARLHRAHQEAAAFVVREKEQLRRPDRAATLAGAQVMIDPAGGPRTPGPTSPDGVPAHEITWAIASRLAGRLAGLGVRPVLSRGPQTTPSTTARAALANRVGVVAILSVRLNHLPSSEAMGAAAYYFGQDAYVSERGRRLAQLAVDNLVAATGTPNCRTHPQALQLLRESRAPAVVVEPGFVSHPEEGRALQDRDHQAVIAAALADALVTYLRGDAPTGRATPASPRLAQV